MDLNYKIDIDVSADHQEQWLVLINGLFADLESWNGVISKLVPSFKILRYDGRGQGKSPRPLSGYDLETLTDDLVELLDHCGIEKASFLGLSNGARVAASFASFYPGRVESLILADSYLEHTPLLTLKLESWLKANQIGGATHRFDIASPWVWGESFLQGKPELVEFYRKKAKEEKNYVIEGLISSALSGGKIDLSSLKAPCLFFAGKEDLLTPSFLQEEMAAQLGGDVLIGKGGHASLLENPENIEELILPWLKLQFLKGTQKEQDNQKEVWV